MLDRLLFDSAPGKDCVGVLVEPGGVGGQVTLPSSHLMDSPCHKLPKAHERVWGTGRVRLILWGSGCIGGPVMEEHVPIAGPERLVCSSHELRGGQVVLGGGGHVKPGGSV